MEIKYLTVILLILGESSPFPQQSQDANENSSSAHVASGISGGTSSSFKRRGQTASRNNGVVNSGVKVGSPLSLTDPAIINKWVSAAYKYFEFNRCTSSSLGSEDECFKLGQVDKGQVVVYLGHSGSSNRINEPGNNGSSSKLISGDKVFAILPDSSSLKESGPHDAILVLDPYPNSPFGHLVAMFYLDFVGTESIQLCKEEGQTLVSDGTCITVGKKHRCPNLLTSSSSGSGLGLHHPVHKRRCHVDFLPTVYTAEKVIGLQTQGKAVDGQRDLLRCIPTLQQYGFSSNCPQLRPVEDTTKILCDSAAVNSKRCDTSHSTVGTTCKLFQTCDRAILLGGGWNSAHSPLQTLSNIRIIQESLKESGFLGENIKTFYANGKISSDYFSSAMKTAFRSHLRTTCDSRHCADTLLIYLNNPVTTEGDFLLWDLDGNGMADHELERYSIKELLSDLAGCLAKRIVLLVEQSYSELLMAALKTSSDHGNVVLLSAGLQNEILIGGQFTQSWVNGSGISSTACLRHVYQMSASYMKGSNPIFYDPSHTGFSSKLSLVGAPCDLNPPVSDTELKTLYQGCQNVPTSIWFSFDFEEIGNMEEDHATIEGHDPGGSESHHHHQHPHSHHHGHRVESLSSSGESSKSHHHHHRHSSSKKRRRARSKRGKSRTAVL